MPRGREYQNMGHDTIGISLLLHVESVSVSQNMVK